MFGFESERFGALAAAVRRDEANWFKFSDHYNTPYRESSQLKLCNSTQKSCDKKQNPHTSIYNILNHIRKGYMNRIKIAKPIKTNAVFFLFSDFENIVKITPINAKIGAKLDGFMS